MGEIVIRDAKLEDVYEMSVVRQKVWSTTYRGIYENKIIDDFDYANSALSFKKKIDEGNNLFKVAIYGEKIIGYVCFRKTIDVYKDYEYVINYLHIVKDYQGQGLGTRFFKMILDYAFKNNISKFYVSCNKYNYPSHKYYEKMGGIKDYVDDDSSSKKEDRVIYVFEVGGCNGD